MAEIQWSKDWSLVPKFIIHAFRVIMLLIDRCDPSRWTMATELDRLSGLGVQSLFISTTVPRVNCFWYKIELISSVVTKV